MIDSGDVRDLVSKSLCNELDSEVERSPISHTVAEGQQSCSAGSLIKVSMVADHPHTSMDFYVRENSSFDGIIAFSALEALPGRLYFGQKLVTLASGDKKATL